MSETDKGSRGSAPRETELARLALFCEQVAHDGILPSLAWFTETAATLKASGVAVPTAQEENELDKLVAEYKFVADNDGEHYIKDLVWLINELIYERDHRDGKVAMPRSDKADLIEGMLSEQRLKAASPAPLRVEEHPPIYADEHGDWAAANRGAASRGTETAVAEDGRARVLRAIRDAKTRLSPGEINRLAADLEARPSGGDAAALRDQIEQLPRIVFNLTPDKLWRANDEYVSLDDVRKLLSPVSGGARTSDGRREP